MIFPKFSVNSLSLIGVVVLAAGLGGAVLGVQQVQELRSRAMYVNDAGGGSGGGSSCTVDIINDANLRGTCSSGQSCRFDPNTCNDYVEYGDSAHPDGIPRDICRGVCQSIASQPPANYGSCSGISGTCLDRDRQTCSTSWNSGNYCPGGDNIQCCVSAGGGGGGGGSSSGGGGGSSSSGGLGGACVNGWTGTCMDHNNPGSCSGTWDEGHSPWPCPNGGNSIWCCVPKPPAPAVPPSPTNVTGSCSVSGTVATVKWSPVSGQPYYFARIHDETTNTEGSYSGVITGSSYSFNNAVPGHKYSYWVHTTNAAGNPYSSEVPKAHTTSFTCTPPPVTNTKFTLELLFHGVGKGGDNKNPQGGGNTNIKHEKRSVIIDVYDLDDKPVITKKEGEVTFNPASGTYKGEVAMGTALTTGAYIIKVKLSHSLRGSITRSITAGTTNVIPQMTLVNGDTNNDAKLDIIDYDIIKGCYSDFDLPPENCDATKKTMADIDDDGNVNQFDLNLFLREMSVQQL